MLSHFPMNWLLPKSSSWPAMIYVSLSKSLVELGSSPPGFHQGRSSYRFPCSPVSVSGVQRVSQRRYNLIHRFGSQSD